MKFTTMLLCEHAVLNERGLVSMLNGGANRIARPGFPALMGLSLVAVIQLPTDYVSGTSVEVEFTVRSPDDSEVFGRAVGGVAAQLLPDADPLVITAAVVLDLSAIVLTKAGAYKVNGAISGGDSASIYFQVVQVDQFATPQKAL